MTGAAPLARAALAVAALAAAAGGLGVQLGFAAVAIGVVGLAHGASDLAMVPSARRAGFLAAYVGAAAVCLGWWLAQPAVALPLFLAASAAHFAIEDAPDGDPVERLARGVGLVAAPAVLHGAAYAALLTAAGGVRPSATIVAIGSAAGLAAAAWLLTLAGRQRDPRLALGAAALLALPPLVGFSVGFLILHALPQTTARARAIGCAGFGAYLRAVSGVFVVALVGLAAVAAAVLRVEPSGIRALFAAIAALAMPHLLVTPWFERRAPAPRLLPA